MKIFLAALSTLLMTAPVSNAWEMIAPKPDTITYASVDECALAWYIWQWKEAGYDMPQDGVAFKWSDFLAPVDPKTDTPQKFDLCKYEDDGQAKGAIVLDTDKDGVYVKSPLGGMLFMMHYITFDKVDGFLRPHKAGKKI